jgi:hypothetical protein
MAPLDSATPVPPTPSLTLPVKTKRCDFEAPGTLVVTRGDGARELWAFGNGETLVRRDAGRAPGSAGPEAGEPPIIFEPAGTVGTSYHWAAVGIRDLAPERRARLLPWARSMGLEVTEGERIWIRDTERVKFVISADLRLAVVLDAPRDLGRATGLLLDTGKTWTVHAWHSTLSRYTKALQSFFLPRPTPSAERVLLTNVYPIGRDAGMRTRIVAGASGRAVAEIVPSAAALSRHGSFVTATDLDWALRVYDAVDGRLRFMVPEAAYLEPVSWSEDDRVLAVGCRLYASSTGAPIFRPAETPVERRDVSFAAEGRTLVELRADGLVAWDLQRGERVRLLDDIVPEPSRIVFDAAERRAAVASARGVTVVDLPEPRLVATMAAPWREDMTSAFPSSPRAAAFALNNAGTELAVADGDRLAVYALPPPGREPMDGTRVPAMSVKLPGHALPAAAAWSSDGAWLAIARRREPEVPYGLLQVALVARRAGLRVERTLSLGRSDLDHLSVGVAFRPGTSTLAISYLADDHRLALYEASSGRRVAERSEGELGYGGELGWSRDGSTLFVDGIADGVLALASDLATVVATTGPGMRGVREVARHGLAPAGSSSRPRCVSNPGETPIAVCSDGGKFWLERPDGARLRLADYRLEGREGALVLDAAGHWDGPPEAAGWLVWQWPPPNRAPPTPAELLAAQRPNLLRTFVEGS